MEVVSGNALNIGALVANNAPCVKSSITNFYYGMGNTATITSIVGAAISVFVLIF